MADLMRFFDLPLETKMRCAVESYQSSNPNTYRGYYPLPEETGWTHFAKGKEYFDIGPEPQMEHPNIPGKEAPTSRIRSPAHDSDEKCFPRAQAKR